MAYLDFEKEENKRLLLRLYAFSRELYNQLYQKDPNWKGKSFHDYVHEAIEKHLKDEDNYDPSKGPLEYHLKYHLIRQSITNDVPTAIKKAYKEDRLKTQEEREMVQKTQTEALPPDPDELGSFCLFISKIESERLFKEIEAEINGDPVLEQLYLAIVWDKYAFNERQEICHDFGISFSDFDNGKRRFMTVLRKVFRKLNIKP